MNIFASLLLLQFTANPACAVGVAGVEQLKNRGHGFCEATLLVKDESGWESIRHLKHCFYKSHDFGECEGLSVSPSGSIALWQAAPTGAIVVYRPSWKAPVVLLKSFPKPSALKSVAWDEPKGFVAFKAWDLPSTYKFAIPSGG